MLLRLTKYSLIALSLSGCSLYQSDGRKFLEKQAFEFSGVALANLRECGYHALTEEWLLVSESEDASVFGSENQEFALRVDIPTQNPAGFGCTFQFSSAQEMTERTEAAIELTHLHLSLGEFAFRPLSHIK